MDTPVLDTPVDSADPALWDAARRLPLTPGQRRALAQLIHDALCEIGRLCAPAALRRVVEGLTTGEPTADLLAQPLDRLYQPISRLMDDRPGALEELARVERACRISRAFEHLALEVADSALRPVLVIGHLDTIDGTWRQWGAFAGQAARILDMTLPDKRTALPRRWAQVPWFDPAAYHPASAGEEGV